MSNLHRFAGQLVASFGAHTPGALAAPIALEEIGARILPYRACRRLLGILNVEEYELLLLRLIAGEEGLASAAPVEAVERCQEELATGNPDLGVLRELGEVTLQLNLGAIAVGTLMEESGANAIVRRYSLHDPEPTINTDTGDLSQATPEPHLDPEPERTAFSEPAPESPVSANSTNPPSAAEPAAPEPAVGPVAEPSSPAAPPIAEPVVPPPPSAQIEPPPRCPHCASRLPAGRPVRFCPHCGGSVVPLVCGRCGADLEPAWRHCVLCGAPAVDESRFA